MTLTPTDILQIQYAIDRYEKKFPRKPPPSAEDALAWQAGMREFDKRPDEAVQSELNHHGSWFRIRHSLGIWP
jgi:hypothetical protein